jgi:uncharacterized membrane-anchored protein YhcB (DUF1043 family)
MPTSQNASIDFLVPVSIGEVVDKITILRIKQQEILDPAKLINIKSELTALEQSYHDHAGTPSELVRNLTGELQSINQKLWHIEDDLRDLERSQNFGNEFVELARAVYFTNDERARLKREINIALGSTLFEEKSYAAYTQ